MVHINYQIWDMPQWKKSYSYISSIVPRVVLRTYHKLTPTFHQMH